MHPKDAEGIANSVDPDQTAPRSRLIWVCTVCPDMSIRKLRKITVKLSDTMINKELCSIWLRVSTCQFTAYQTTEPPHDKTNKMACAPSEDSDQPGHPPSLFRVLAVRMKKAQILSYPLSAQRRLWSDWANHFVGYVTRRLNFSFFLRFNTFSSIIYVYTKSCVFSINN